MATGFKVFPSEVIKSLTLRSVRFEFEPEVTAKVLLSGCKIIEVPIPYKPRTVLEGKKIGWLDGLEYIFTLIRYRFFFDSPIGSQVGLLTINPDLDIIPI